MSDGPGGVEPLKGQFSTDPTGLPECRPPEVVELSDGDEFDLRIGSVAKRLGDTTVRMLAYNGSVPGPIVRVQEGSELVVNVVNEGDTEATVHWHGLRLDNRYDGTHETPDVFSRSLEGWPDAEPLVGREAVMRSFEQLRETWDADAAEPISFIDGGDRVVVRMVWRGVGHGPEMNMEVTQVYTVRKGKVFLLEAFWDHAEALEAMGLSEQDAHSDSS